MIPLKALAILLILILVLWAAYRVGQVVLRILAGLVFMALAGVVVWYLFIR